MKYLRHLILFSLMLVLLTGCGSHETVSSGKDTIVATTYPMYFLTSRLTEGMEDVTVEVLVQEQVSCLHDYTLTTTQMKTIEQADLLVINGLELEHFLESALSSFPEERMIDASAELSVEDPHYWLNISCFKTASATVAEALCARYPDSEAVIRENMNLLDNDLSALQEEMTSGLASLSCRELITFHDGFSLFAEGLNLTIAAAIEEEEGAEASAQQIQQICDLINSHNIPAIFVEKNGSTNASGIIASETGVQVFTLNTMMDGEADYFTAMRNNASAIREALS